MPLFFVNCERTVLFSVKRDLDPPLLPFTTLNDSTSTLRFFAFYVLGECHCPPYRTALLQTILIICSWNHLADIDVVEVSPFAAMFSVQGHQLLGGNPPDLKPLFRVDFSVTQITARAVVWKHVTLTLYLEHGSFLWLWSTQGRFSVQRF